MKVRKSRNHCKKVIETVKLAYVNNTKKSVTTKKLDYPDFWQIAYVNNTKKSVTTKKLDYLTFGKFLIAFSTKINLLYLLYVMVLRCCLLHLIKHSVSLGTVPLLPIPLANHNQAIFSDFPDTEKITSPSRQTETPDNLNMLHMFNNNTYTDFRTAYKGVIIPSYGI